MFDEDKPNGAFTECTLPTKDGPTSHLPFSEAAKQDPEFLPVTPDLFCCAFGPCKYYELTSVLTQEKGTGVVADQRRICKRLQDDEGDGDLTENNVDRCTAFTPPWWSYTGWKELYMVARKLQASHEVTSAGPLTLRFRFWVALMIGTILNWPMGTLRFLDVDDEPELLSDGKEGK